MWELDCEEGWALKNWCFWTVVLEKTLESPLDCKEIQPVHSEGDQPWDFVGRSDANAETPVLWPPHAKSWLIGKDCDAGRDWGQEEKGTTKDEMAWWHHWLNGRESKWTPGVGDGQGGLACCNSWGHKESDTTEWLNWTEDHMKQMYLLQGSFPTQGSNPHLPHCRWILYYLSHKGSPRVLERVVYPFSRGTFWPRNRTGVFCIAGRFFTSWATGEAQNRSNLELN